MFEGTVSGVSSRRWNDKMLHSFRLVNDGRYFNCGIVPPQVNEGDQVTFNGDADGNKVKVDTRSIKVTGRVETETIVPQKGSFRKTFTKSFDSKDEYWRKREERDVKTQEIIQLQSSRNSAIALADLLLRNAAIDLGKVAKKNVQQTIEDLVDHLTDKFEQVAKNRRDGEAAEIQEEKEEETTSDDTSNDDEWA